MNRIFLLLLVFVSFFALFSCTGGKRSKKDSASDTSKVADTPQNYKVYKLPADLDEISGISFIDSTNLVAVEDEEGIIYSYNLTDSKITNKKTFAGSGDYEDLAIAGKDLYVMTSDGLLYEIKNYEDPASKATEIQTPFNGKNNVEGLAYDKKNNRLLIAPKNKGFDTDKDKEIYELNLKTRQINMTPVFSLSLSLIEDYFKGDALEESSKDFLKALGNQNLNEVFRPSAIAVHPKTNEIYILSSINNLLAVLGVDGKLKRILELKGKEFLQPEGLAFTASGELYISNEGKGGKANIIHLTL